MVLRYRPSSLWLIVAITFITTYTTNGEQYSMPIPSAGAPHGMPMPGPENVFASLTDDDMPNHLEQRADFKLKFGSAVPIHGERKEVPKDQEDKCNTNIAKAQQFYSQQRYEQATAELDACIKILQDVSGFGVLEHSYWRMYPFSTWHFLFFYRALVAWKQGGADNLKSAAKDIARAISMTDHPEYFAMQTGIATSQENYEVAFEATAHELILHLGLRIHLDEHCHRHGEYHWCNWKDLVVYLEKKFGWHTEAQEPLQVYKLWQVSNVEDAYPIATLQHIVRCLRSLLYTRTQLPASSILRLTSTSQLPHLLSMFLPADARLHEEASTVLFGEGDVLRGLSHSMHDMAIQLNGTLTFDTTSPTSHDEEGGVIVPMHESWTALLRYGALLLSAGLETHLTNVARRLLGSSISAVSTIETISKNCKVSFCDQAAIEDPAGAQTRENCTNVISYATLRRVFTSCLKTQKVLQTLFKEDADSHRSSLHSTNEFGFNSMHHFVLYGDTDLVETLLHLDARSSPEIRNSMTHFGLSGLHLAAIRGNAPMASTLLRLGVTQNWKDWKSRTALDVMCTHGFPWNLEVAEVLAHDLPANPQAYCEAIRFSATKSPLDLRPAQVQQLSCIQSGGWAPPIVYSQSIMPDPYPCLSPISLTPKLSLVSAEERKEHVASQRALRTADGSAKEQDPVEVGTLPKTPFSKLYSTTCQLPILRPPTSYSQFISEIVALQRPVLIRGGLNWELIQFAETYHALQREELLKKYGNVHLSSANIPYAETFGLPAYESTLAQFLGVMHDLNTKDQLLKTSEGANQWTNASNFLHRPYVFISIPLPEDASQAKSHIEADPTNPTALLPLFVSPSWLHPPPVEEPVPSDSAPQLDPTTHTPLTLRKLQFFLGPRFSGAPEHFHRSALNMQWFGRKHWTIRPPHAAAYRKESKIEEIARAQAEGETPSITESEQTLECIQEPGDIVFVPDFWSHATINLEESIGFAAELLWGATHFSV